MTKKDTYFKRITIIWYNSLRTNGNGFTFESIKYSGKLVACQIDTICDTLTKPLLTHMNKNLQQTAGEDSYIFTKTIQPK